MNIAILGEDCALSRATAERLKALGHRVAADARECVVYFPGSLESLENILRDHTLGRLVIRSHAAVYGAAAKNPGYMTEERLALLDGEAPEQIWLRAEQMASRHGNWAAVRLSNTLVRPQDSAADSLVMAFSRKQPGVVDVIAGRDPNVQFISLDDAANALAAAATSNATGVFNATGAGSLPLKTALRAAGIRRVPVPKWVRSALHSRESAERLEYNWTVSGGRAADELDFHPTDSSVAALEKYIFAKGGGNPEVLRREFDPWGLDLDYIAAWGPWFKFLKKVYWRIDFEGMENISTAGRGVFVSNHRGFMPLDAVMHLSLAMAERQRVIRFLIIPCLLYFPFLSNFMTKLGGVIASQENAARLMEGENLAGIFPEGIRGTFQPYRETYKLRDFAKSAFAAVAVEHQAPIIPAAVIGHAEIFPIVGRFNWAYAKRVTGWPYFPIAPPFPFLPFVPLPTKWHVRVLSPVPVTDFKPEDARNEKLMAGLARYVQSIVQQNIDEMRARRKHIFWGRVLNGTAPARASVPADLRVSRV